MEGGSNKGYEVSECMAALDVHHGEGKEKSLLDACKNAEKEAFECLVKNEADLKVKDKRHRNILFAAIESCDYDFFKYVTGRLQHHGILHELMKEKDNYVGSERYFLVSGKDQGKLGYHYVEVHRVYLDIFQGIIRRGGACDVAKYGEVFKSGWGTPPQEVREEVALRYDPSKKEKMEDMTPLHFAFIQEQPEMALELMRLGADVDVEDCFGLRPVHLACMRGYLDVLAELEKREANFNVYEKFGMTPAQVAEANRQLKAEYFFTGNEYISDPKLEDFKQKFATTLEGPMKTKLGAIAKTNEMLESMKEYMEHLAADECNQRQHRTQDSLQKQQNFLGLRPCLFALITLITACFIIPIYM